MTDSGTTRAGFDLESLVRPKIWSLRPYRSARDTVSEGLLLDANESPYDESFDGIALNRYPDPRQLRLRHALAERLEVGVDQVVAGVGSDEVLDWTLKVFCQPGIDLAAAASPSYGMYRVQSDILGVDLVPIPLVERFDVSSKRFLAALPKGVKVLFLCSPNNPTGNLLSRSEILQLCASWKGVVVVDEAYIEFSDAESLAGEATKRPNLVVMRTFSKAWGRAAIRLGYAVASAPIIGLFLKVKAPYNLSSLALGEGERALAQSSDLEFRIAEIRAERERLIIELGKFPRVARVFPSQANFILFECAPASAVCARLREKGVVIRDRSGVPRLEHCLRVSLGTRPQNDFFLARLAEALAEVGP